MLRLLCTGEMAHQQRNAVIFGTYARRERRCFVDGNTEAVHARIDMQCSPASPLIGGAECIPLREFDEAANHRLSGDIGEGRSSSRQKAVEHINGGVWRSDACPARLRYVRDKKCPAARMGESASDRLDTAAISVGFDDGGAF